MRLKIVLAFLIFLVSIFSIGQNLGKPFWGEHDWNGVRYGNIARNFLRYGILDLKFAQVENSGPLEDQQFVYYTHYPPLLPILISLSYKIFGVSEFSTRIVPTIFTAGAISLIFLIGSTLFSKRIGLLASLFSILIPMTLYFGKNASHEPIALFFILLSFYGFILYKRKVMYSLALFIIGIIFAEMSAWAGYFLIPAITLVAIFKKSIKEIKFILPFWFLSIFLFLIHLGVVYLATGTSFGGGLFDALLYRSGIAINLAPEGFDLIGYLQRIRLWFFITFSATLTIISLCWVIKGFIRKFSDEDLDIFILGLIGVIYLIVFSNAAFIHNYLLFYFLPFLTISAASLLFSLKNINKFKNIYLIFIIVILFLVVNERRDFLIALNNSQADKLAVDVGKAIDRDTKLEDKILIKPSSFVNSADYFLKFYSNRQLIYEGVGQSTVLVDQENRKFEIID